MTGGTDDETVIRGRVETVAGVVLREKKLVGSPDKTVVANAPRPASLVLESSVLHPCGSGDYPIL